MGRERSDHNADATEPSAYSNGMLWNGNDSSEWPLNKEMRSLPSHSGPVIRWRLSPEEGRGSFLEGDGAVGPLQPAPPRAGGMNVIILNKPSVQHLKVNATDQVRRDENKLENSSTTSEVQSWLMSRLQAESHGQQRGSLFQILLLCLSLLESERRLQVSHNFC